MPPRPGSRRGMNAQEQMFDLIDVTRVEARGGSM
jgi:hypothetical protein